MITNNIFYYLNDHSEENHHIKTMKHVKKNRVVQKTYYITGRVE
jgi:hypothetical protein